ncbi:MAG TPA: hypothetical protein PKW33_21115 [Anaerolineaceae bacterium]|nr:hypothetical protein [Anaerolineaceae bacterium]HPN54111.1 hypothetical protein [Anaerolineaceae bacterium]
MKEFIFVSSYSIDEICTQMEVFFMRHPENYILTERVRPFDGDLFQQILFNNTIGWCQVGAIGGIEFHRIGKKTHLRPILPPPPKDQEIICDLAGTPKWAEEAVAEVESAIRSIEIRFNVSRLMLSDFNEQEQILDLFNASSRKIISGRQELLEKTLDLVFEDLASQGLIKSVSKSDFPEKRKRGRPNLSEEEITVRIAIGILLDREQNLHPSWTHAMLGKNLGLEIPDQDLETLTSRCDDCLRLYKKNQDNADLISRACQKLETMLADTPNRDRLWLRYVKNE